MRRLRALAVLAALLAGATLAAVLLGRGGGPRGRILLVQTGDDRGFLEPCGCSGFQAGGYARRLPLLRREGARPEALVLHAGETFHHRLPPAADDYRRARHAFQADLLRAMGYDLLVLPSRDQKAIEESGVASPGKVDHEAYEKPFLGGLLTQIEALRVAVFSETCRKETGSLVEDYDYMMPKQPPDLVFFAGTDLDVAGIEDLAAVWTGPPLAVLSRVLPAGAGPRRGRVVAARAAGDLGETVLLWELEVAGREVIAGEPRLIRLGPEHPEDPATRAMLDEYDHSLRDGAALRAVERRPAPGGPYAGGAACARCHEAEARQWAGTKHAHAEEALKPRGHGDPECVRCHSTGLGFEGGFVGWKETPDRGSVSCEACHGPGARHVADPARVRTEPVAEA
ncbi:MAG: cytochrome c family protein, partial [Planctomycetales bacterium]|nr:cytochrome c family protein [Planctomycetales bacterium]